MSSEELDLWPILERVLTNILRARGKTDAEIMEAIEEAWREYEAGKKGLPEKYHGRKWSPAAASHPED